LNDRAHREYIAWAAVYARIGQGRTGVALGTPSPKGGAFTSTSFVT
jgi:hypothetical protein